MRKVKREVKIGNVVIGGHNPVAVQTMLNVPVRLSTRICTEVRS